MQAVNSHYTESNSGLAYISTEEDIYSIGYRTADSWGCISSWTLPRKLFESSTGACNTLALVAKTLMVISLKWPKDFSSSFICLWTECHPRICPARDTTPVFHRGGIKTRSEAECLQ